ncbi:VOC family protein [Streptomyces sp. N2-109]|uniref:VOC family protein n=1 Tax=Streptomyces gossypii TaxID=2883101 RepID=A0ABT2JSA2_9ACTN|nr:VOC family protein [Streptomyces gossypii]MCT2590636.1 VOC family protein [Streptomyces gossypii]
MTEAATRHRHAHGTPCWASLRVHGLSASQIFYRELLGWEFQPGTGQPSPYVRAFAEGRQVADLGELARASGRQPTAWLPYLASDDADATADLIRECCGTVAVGPLKVPGGRLAIASDPGGASFGVWQPTASQLPGTSAEGSLGTPVWHQLLTRETRRVQGFYSAVFGYETEQPGIAASGSLTLCLEGQAVAGVHGMGSELPRDRGPYWETYFAVEDPDAAADQAKQLGGEVLCGPRDSPYGRLARLADPEGAPFGVLRKGGGPG